MYNIEVGGVPYNIRLHSYSVEINGVSYKLRKLPARRVLFFTLEIELPIPEGKVLLATGLWRPELVVDGVKVRSGKPYTPVGKIPVWAYIVCVLDLLFIINGALGSVLAIIGVLLTLKLAASEDLAPPLRLILSLVYLVGAWVFVFLLALLVFSAGLAAY